MKLAAIIIPIYNEKETVVNLAKKINDVFLTIQNWDYLIYFIDDGSGEGTKHCLNQLKQENAKIKLITFNNNYGHQFAIQAGMKNAKGDAIIIMDGDLQHPPHYIKEMIQVFDDGKEYIQMVRNRKTFGIKGVLSSLFYRMFNKLSGMQLIENAPDFRLISPRIQLLFNNVQHKNKILRILPSIYEFDVEIIRYEEDGRFAGQSKYSVWKSIGFALNTMFNFGTLPLSFIFVTGIIVSLLSFSAGVASIIAKLILGNKVVPGYTDIICAILFLSGSILGAIGIIGKYLKIIFDEIVQYPSYVIKNDKDSN